MLPKKTAFLSYSELELFCTELSFKESIIGIEKKKQDSLRGSKIDREGCVCSLFMVPTSPGKSWKVLEFEKSPGKSWKVLKFCWNFGKVLEKSWNVFVVKQSKRDF